MIALITGGCKNGKSNTAQDMAVKLSSDGQKSLYYVATMISTGTEDDLRIEKHVENRRGLGFETLEIKRNIVDLKDIITRDCGKATFLIDSLTALLANEMFRTDSEGHFYVDGDALSRISCELKELMTEAVKLGSDLIFVSDGIYSDAAIYDSDTESYREGLAHLEKTVAKMADKTIEMCAGTDTKLQDIFDDEIQIYGDSEMMEDGGSRAALVIGGASQGKRAFAKDKFGLEDSDIYCFGYEDKEVPEGYRAYDHVERLIRKRLEISDNFDLDSSFDKAEVLIIEDITCGIVPMDALDRKWREETGRLMQRLGKPRDIYRVFCGKGVHIK